MGGSSSRIKYKDFTCNGNQIPPREPIKFKNLKHIRCMFFTQESYNAKLHIPKSLTLEFDSTILNLEKEVLSFQDKKKNNVILASNLVGKTILEADFEKELDAFLKQVIAFQDDEKAKHSKSEQELQRLKDKLKELNNFGTSLIINDELTVNIQEKINAISVVINQSGLKTIEEVYKCNLGSYKPKWIKNN